MSSIFISHSSHDNSFTQNIVDFLKQKGHQSFFLDSDPRRGIPPGRNWEKELYINLRKCQAVIGDSAVSDHSISLLIDHPKLYEERRHVVVFTGRLKLAV